MKTVVFSFIVAVIGLISPAAFAQISDSAIFNISVYLDEPDERTQSERIRLCKQPINQSREYCAAISAASSTSQSVFSTQPTGQSTSSALSQQVDPNNSEHVSDAIGELLGLSASEVSQLLAISNIAVDDVDSFVYTISPI